MEVGTRILEAFNRWFTSAAGVWHTFILVGIVVILEQTKVLNDHNGFWLLYWLTVYSAITQPALAYVARQGGDREDVILRHLEALVEHVIEDVEG